MTAPTTRAPQPPAPATWHEPCTDAQPHPDHHHADLHGQHATAAGIRTATTLQPAEEYL